MTFKKLFLLITTLLLLLVFVACDEVKSNTPEPPTDIEEKSDFEETTAGSVGLAYDVNFDEKTCTITGMGSCTDVEVFIPKKIDGYKVTAIGDRAFSECTSIKFIKIPETVTKIGVRAFYGCIGITEITIPESVTSIGTQILYKAENLNTVYYNSAYASSENPFLNLKSVTKVVFNGAEIPMFILQDNTYVRKIEIKNNVTSIQYGAFYGCSNLESISIGTNVKKIENNVFEGCNNLTDVYVSDISAWLNITFDSDKSGTYPNFSTPLVHPNVALHILDSKGNKTTRLVIPDTVTIIRKYAFENCRDLVDITIPDSVTSIEDSAFSGCSSLTNIAIPDSVTSIGNKAFSECSNLKNIVIPDSVTKIDKCAFSNCIKLESITLPVDLKDISTSMLSGCSSLTAIEIPNGVEEISPYAFDGCNLTEIQIPNSVTTIWSGAFEGCENLNEIVFDGTVAQWKSIFLDYRWWGNVPVTKIICSNGTVPIDWYPFYQ